MSEKVHSYKELRVWQGAMDLVETVYRLSSKLPPEEIYGLRSQLRRAAASVPCNIAEGQSRTSTREFINHISMARASLAEVETQIEISKRLSYLSSEEVETVLSAIQALGRQLHALRKALEARK